MEQKDKELLLKDLCARLPYEVKCNVGERIPYTLCRIEIDNVNGHLLDFIETKDDLDMQVYLSEVKPYLFPLTSITEEQNKILIKNYHFSFNSCSDGITNGIYSPTFNRTIYYSVDEDDISKIIDWLNKNHFDYRALIEKGLAIDATELNIY